MPAIVTAVTVEVLLHSRAEEAVLYPYLVQARRGCRAAEGVGFEVDVRPLTNRPQHPSRSWERRASHSARTATRQGPQLPSPNLVLRLYCRPWSLPQPPPPPAPPPLLQEHRQLEASLLQAMRLRHVRDGWQSMAEAMGEAMKV